MLSVARRVGHPRAVLEPQPAVVDEVQQRLTQEERVAVGLGGEQRRERLRHLVARQPLEQRVHVVGAEPVERDARGLDFTLQQWERVRERVPAVEIGLAVGTDHRQARPGGQARQRTQHADRRVVGPVQILDDQRDR